MRFKIIGMLFFVCLQLQNKSTCCNSDALSIIPPNDYFAYEPPIMKDVYAVLKSAQYKEREVALMDDYRNIRCRVEAQKKFLFSLWQIFWPERHDSHDFSEEEAIATHLIINTIRLEKEENNPGDDFLDLYCNYLLMGLEGQIQSHGIEYLDKFQVVLTDYFLDSHCL